MKKSFKQIALVGHFVRILARLVVPVTLLGSVMVVFAEPHPIAEPPERIPALKTSLQKEPLPEPLAPSSQVPGAWTFLGPAPTINAGVATPPDNRVCGAIQAVAAHPANANILYIGAVNGGVWRTANATAANPIWTPLSNGLPSLSIGSLELDPTDAANQTIVAGSARVSSFASRGGLLIGMLRSTNGGNTWTILGSTLFANENLTSVAARGNVLMAASDGLAAGSGTGLFRSTNTGTSFQLVSGAFGTGLPAGDVTDLAGDPSNLNRFYAGVGNVGVFRSDDAGVTWSNVTAGITGPTAAARIKIAVHNAGGAVYVGTVTNGRLAGVFRSA